MYPYDQDGCTTLQPGIMINLRVGNWKLSLPHFRLQDTRISLLAEINY